MQPTKVIFLDIDGVLNNRASIIAGMDARNMYTMHRPCVEELNTLVYETNADIVVSSTWRFRFDVQDLRGILMEFGFRYAPHVIDITPRRLKDTLPLSTDPRVVQPPTPTRGKEIQEWLDGNKTVKKFCILDDDSDMEHLLPFLVKTDHEIGLTSLQGAQAVQLLGRWP